MIRDMPRGYRARYALVLAAQLLGYAAAAGIIIAGVITLAVVLLFGVTGCAAPPRSGAILHKEYSAAYSWVSTVCAAYNSRGMCTVYMPIVIQEPAHYRLCLVDDADQAARKAGTCRYREVDSATFREYREGDHYPRTDPR